MTPVVSFPSVAKIAALFGDVVKHVADKANFANSVRHVCQVGGQVPIGRHVPAAPRLVRLESHEEGRAALTMKSGNDPSLSRRLISLERAAARRPSSQQGTPTSDTSKPSDNANMFVQKAAVLAKDYLRTAERDTTPGWVRAAESWQWPSAASPLRVGQTLRRVPVADSSPSSMTSPSATWKHRTGIVLKCRDLFSGLGHRIDNNHSERASRQGDAPSFGKDVERHTAKALRRLQDELGSTAQIFDGSRRGEEARRLGEDVGRALAETGRHDALRVASQGIRAVRSASAELVVESIAPRSADHIELQPLQETRTRNDAIESPPSSGTSSVHGDTKTLSQDSSSDSAVGTSGSDSEGEDVVVTMKRPVSNAQYVRELRVIQKQLFDMARRYPGTERGIAARNLHSANQKIFEAVDAKAAYNGAIRLMPGIRSMPTVRAG